MVWVGLGVALTACAIEQPGISPFPNQFYFPTGLAIDPVRPVLYVGNTNADLRFNGGTIMALDISALPTDLSKIGEEVKASRLNCEAGRLEPGRWECEEAQFVISDATIRTGDFPGELRISSKGDRLYVPVRGENHLLWMDIVQTSQTTGKVDLRCNADVFLGCGAVPNDTNCTAWDCGSENQISYSSRAQKRLALDPFGIELNELVAVHVDAEGQRHTCRDGGAAVPCDCGAAAACPEPDSALPTANCCIDPPAGDHIYLAHLSGGEISFAYADESGVELRDVSGNVFNTSSAVKGGFSVEPSLPGDARSPIYAGSRTSSQLASFVIWDDTRVVSGSQTSVSLVSPATGQYFDVRGVARAPGGKQLFVVSRSPPTMIAVDVSLDQNGDAKREPMWAVELCADPSLLRTIANPQHADDPGALLALVVCFGEEQIYVIDTKLAEVVGRIFTGRGPHVLEVDAPNQRAFVANFLDNTVGVIDLNPDRSTYLQMVLQIGHVTQLEQNL